ncbi:MAG: FAD-binding oxidoreductase [Gemmatimonadota bacterium]
MERRTFLRSVAAAAAAVSTPRVGTLAGMLTPPGYRAAVHVGQVPPDVLAVTGDGREVVIRGRDIAELARSLRGRVLLAGSEGYETARLVLNPSFDRHPALIAQVTGAADVRRAVDFARGNHGLLLAVKCGGHSFSGASTCDRGMMIDLSPFRAVQVDPTARRAWVTGGSLLGAVDHEAMDHGLATPLGTVSHTGVGGLVTGGGFGRLARRFGLSIDNLESVQVVTADGRLLRASAGENEDLFWGVRGGGGNFGVVTAFEFRLHPLERRVIAGRIRFPRSRARESLELYAEYAPTAPDEIQLDWGIALPPRGEEAVVGFDICFSGRASDLERALGPIRRLGTPMEDTLEEKDYVEVQRAGDITDPRAQAGYLKNGFVTRITPGLVTPIVEALEGHPERGTGVNFVQSGGAIGRVAPEATAFPQRDAEFMMLGGTGWAHGGDADPQEHIGYMRSFWGEHLEPHTHGFYTNDMPLEAVDADVARNYRDNLTRLVAVKNRYDPQNLFRLNANVQPSG